MAKAKLLRLVLLFGFAAAWVAAADLGAPQPFSADYSTTRTDGQKIIGKWYFSPPKIRIDITSMSQKASGTPFGGSFAMIIDGSTQTTYMLLPQMHMYMQGQGNSSRMDPGIRNLTNLWNGSCPQGATCNKVGSEAVNGRNCDKYEVTNESGKKSTLWVDQKVNFPIRMQQDNGNVTEFTNIKEGAPDSDLFKVPPDYHAFNPGAFAGGKQ